VKKTDFVMHQSPATNLELYCFLL